MRWRLVVGIVALGLAGCQAGGGIDVLKEENRKLADELESSRMAVAKLEAERSNLQATVAEQADVIDVLTHEKSSRVAESSRLRGQARAFVRSQMADLRDFLQQGELLDYFGGELVARSQQDSTPALIVDAGNAMPDNGTLSGLAGYFTGPGVVQVKILRPVDDQFVVLWESRPISVESGRQRAEFAVAVGVERGDLVAYWFAEGVNVPWDRGTGRTVVGDRALKLGQMVELDDFDAESERRAYSIGVTGLID